MNFLKVNHMKKTKSKYIFLLLILGFSACTQDFLELQPKTNKLETNFYKSEDDAFLALSAVYNALHVQNWQFVPTMSDIKSDDAFTGGDPSGNDMPQYQQQEKFTIDLENAAVSALWSRCYSGIYRANILLDKIGQIEWKNDANKTRITAEAKFLRAYFYWDLVRHYGWVPILTKVESNPDILNSLPQSTPQDVYKQIATDLLDAQIGLPQTVPDAEIGRATKYAVNSLIARIYLYYEGFAKPVLGITENWSNGTTTIDKTFVKTALNEVITSGSFIVLPKYADVFDWANENNKEMIFSFQYDGSSASGDWGGWGINGNFSSISLGPRDPEGDASIVAGWSMSPLSFSLAAEYEVGDPRKDVSMYNAAVKLTKYTKGFQNTGFFNNKFLAQSAYQSAKGEKAHNYPINYPDIRFADVLLMAAEINLTDNPTQAVQYFNIVRTRALGIGGAKVSITLDDIYHERRLEFAGEGHRYWDLLRRGLDYAEQKINASFLNIPTDNPMISPVDFAPRNFVKETYGMFPIPAGEVRITSGNLKQFIPAYK